MIRKIGVIYQDANSLGFLQGLRARLNCDAEFVAPPAAIGKSQHLTSKQAKHAWLYFKTRGVDLVIRFTDADRDRWQEVRRKELNVFPDEAQSMILCGVAVNNPEEWLYLDKGYLAGALELRLDELADSRDRTNRIKNAISRCRREHEKTSDVIAALVRDAPAEVFHRWLVADDALRAFYSDCRSAADRAGCETPNEMGDPNHD